MDVAADIGDLHEVVTGVTTGPEPTRERPDGCFVAAMTGNQGWDAERGLASAAWATKAFVRGERS